VNDISKPGQTVILMVNKQNKEYVRISRQNPNFIYDTKKICDKKNITEKIIFYFICGFKLQKPRIKEELCVTNVFNTDPDICHNKVCTLEFISYYIL